MSEEERSEIIFDLSELNELASVEEKLIRVNDMLTEAEESLQDYGSDLSVSFEGKNKEGFKTAIVELLKKLHSQLAETRTTSDINYDILVPRIIAQLMGELKEKWEIDFTLDKHAKLADDIYEANEATGVHGNTLDRIEGVALDADSVAAAIVEEVERSVTTESLTGKDKSQEELRAKVQESGITKDIQPKNLPLLYRGTTIDELMSQFDPKTGQFVMAAPYTKTGKLIRERIKEGKKVDTSDIAEQVKEEIEEGKVLGPSMSRQIEPAVRFSQMGARKELVTDQNPRIVMMIEQEAMQEAEAVNMEDVTEEKKMEFFDLSYRVYGPSGAARYEHAFNPNDTIARLSVNMYKLLPSHPEFKPLEDIRIQVKDTFVREEDLDAFMVDVEKWQKGEVFSPENPASEATIVFSEKGASFPEAEVTSILPVHARPDQVTIFVVPKDIETGKFPAHTERMAEKIQKMLTELSPFFNKVRIITLGEQGGYETVDKIAAAEDMGINKLDNYVNEDELQLAKWAERKGIGPPVVEPAKVTDMVNKVVKNVVINLGIVDASDKEKLVQLTLKIANRYIKEYIIGLFETVI